jgi:sugar phosphate isomerase/epimerase
MADQRGMGLTLEFAPPHSINTFEKALAAVRGIAQPNLRLTIDAMHFFRTGGSVGEIARAGGECVGHLQLCDVPLLAPIEDYYQEACFSRGMPGEGELPLRELLSVVPKTVRVGLEIPMQARIGTEASLEVLVERAVRLAQDLLQEDADSCAETPASLSTVPGGPAVSRSSPL